MYDAWSGVPPTPTQVHDRVTLTYGLEYQHIGATDFPTTSDRLIVLQAAVKSRDISLELLEQEETVKARLASRSPRERQAVDDYWGYVRSSLWWASSGVRNMLERHAYLSAIRRDAAGFLAAFDQARTAGDPDVLRSMANDVTARRDLALEVARACLSPTTHEFLRYLKSESPSYDALLHKYARSRFGRSYSDLLNDNERVLVLGDVVEASGRSTKLVKILSKVSGAIGLAALLFALASTVWEIAQASDPIGQAVKDVWTIGAGTAAGLTAETAAVSMIESGALSAGASLSTAGAVGLLGGLAAGVIVGVAATAVAEALFDLVVDAFRLRIPPALLERPLRPMVTPLHSPLYGYLSGSMRSPVGV